MTRKLLIIALFCLVPMGVTTALAAGVYDHEISEGDMTFAWKVDGDTLHGKMSAKTEGWVAVGFNPSSKMKDANFILGYVKSGKAKVVDHFGNRSVGHSSDKKLGGSEDVTLVGGTEEGGVTTIEFTIPMNSGDDYDGEIVADGDTVLLMSYGPDRDSFRPRHRDKAQVTVNLSTGARK